MKRRSLRKRGREAGRSRALEALERLDPSHSFWVRGLALGLIFLPAALGFLYVRAFGVDVPFGDAWTMVERFDKLSLGTLGFRDLWAQHYEHRLFFTRIALLLLGSVTSFDNVADLYLTQTLLLVTLVVLLVAFRRGIGAGRLLFFVPISFLVFSLAQWFNMLNSLQLAFALTQASCVLAFYLLHVSARGKIRWPAFFAALASGVVASFSFLVGLLVWPAGFVQLLVSPVERSKKRVLLLVWSLVGVAAYAAYLYRLVVPDRLSGYYFYESPSLGLDYFLTALGNTLFQQPVLAFASGLVLVCVIAASLFLVHRAGKLGECSFWVGLLAFALIVLATQTLGRGGGGIQSALQSRYITFSCLAVVGAYALLVKLFVEGGRRRGVVAIPLGILSALILLSIPPSYAGAISTGGQLEAEREEAVAEIAAYSSQPDKDLDVLNRGSEAVRSGSFVLCKLGYSVFSEPGLREQNCLPPPLSTLSPNDSTTLSEVETVAGRKVGRGGRPAVVPNGSSSVSVYGWAVDEEARGPAGGVYLKVDDRLFPAFYGRSKKKVAAELGVPGYEMSGFEGEVPVSDLKPGRHKLSVIVLTKDRRERYRPGQEVILRVKGERRAGEAGAGRMVRVPGGTAASGSDAASAAHSSRSGTPGSAVRDF